MGNEVMEAIFGRAGRGRQRSAPKQDLISEVSIGFVDAAKGAEKELTYLMPGHEGGNRTIRVRIPAGVKDGGRVRLRGQGADGGDLVLKINNYTLNEGEKSVFDSELHGRHGRPGERGKGVARAGRDFDNSSSCQLCWQRGDVVCCDHCPVVMHLACAGIEDETELGSTWSCPHHKCHLCGRKASAAGRMLIAECNDTWIRLLEVGPLFFL